MSPTTIKLENVFTGASIPDELKSAVIYDTKASASDRKMTVTIASDSLINYGVIEKFKQYIKDKYSLNEFILKVKYIDANITATSFFM